VNNFMPHLKSETNRFAAVLLGCFALLFMGASLLSQESESADQFSTEFIRFVKTAKKEGHVDTAVKSYFRERDQVVVTLAAVVHIGDASYYDKFQKLFEGYDAVLYEMIRDENTLPSTEIDTDHPISQLQMGMKNMLDLEFQLERIDYGKTNFVHADLNPDSFADLQAERGESLFGILLRAALEEQSRQNANPDQALNPFELLFALASDDRSHQLKFLLGQQMGNVEAMLGGVDKSADGKGSAILSGRNEHVMKVLDEQIAEGKKRLVIFYGAGHMPDLKKRLDGEGFKKVTEHWSVAWDITKKNPATVQPGSD
jgi:hypothetical protein